MNMPQPKPWVDAIAPYVPGKSGPAGRRLAKLSANENPLGPSPAAVEAAATAARTMHLYPDGGSSALRHAVADKFGLEFDRIIAGAGSDELLQFVSAAFAGPGDEVLMTRYCFSIYPICAWRVGATAVRADERDYTADVDALLAAVTERTRVLYLANPNNPTGTMITRGEVERLRAVLRPDVLLVLDGAYAEYLDGDPDYEDGIAMSLAHGNVLTTRTFSKIHGLAAQRIAWAHGSREVIAALDKVRGPFNTTTAGVEAAVAALGDDAAQARAREHNRVWRDWLFGQCVQLSNRGVRAIPSVANFVLMIFPDNGPVTARGAFEALMADGFVTRWLVPQGMDNALRISVGTEEETRGVAAALRRYVERG